MTAHTSASDSPQFGRSLTALLLLLTVFAPISMDLYLPVLPHLTAELDATTSVAQLTVTACLIGLAAGQLIAGPLSDRYGRRSPLLIGISMFVLASVACAISPSIEILVAARLLQGLAAAVGVVIAMAAGRDIYSGAVLIRYYAQLTILGGLAAIVGPIIGGQLARFTDWRGLFLFLAAVGAALLLLSLLLFRETLPRHRRITAKTTHSADRGIRVLLRDRAFVGAILICGFSNAAIFAYLSGATYILQGIYGLNPQQYSFAFGLNALGVVIAGYIAGRLAARWSQKGTLVVGLLIAAAGAVTLLITGLLHLPLPMIMTALFLTVSGVSLAAPPNTSLALEEYPHLAGTASSLLGFTRFGFGGIAAPLVGLAGDDTAVPLGIVTVVVVALSLITYVVFVRDAPTKAPAPTATRDQHESDMPAVPAK